MKMHGVLTVAAALAITGVAQAQVWVEAGDAGDMPGTAQIPAGIGNLLSITGQLSNGADIDMYQIFIHDAAAFIAEVTAFAGGSTDSQLYLFNANGVGIAFDDDSGLGLFSRLSNDHTINVGGAPDNIGQSNLILNAGVGVYYLAITKFDTDALNLAGGTQAANGIWHDGSPFAGPFQPDGPGAGNATLAGWGLASTTGNPIYTITLTGASFVPAPGALALLGLAGLAGIRRRRG
jgi:MYXO-CTERM domain-containing protein